MRIQVWMGSPRPHGNTSALLRPFLEECRAAGADVQVEALYQREVRPCMGCQHCQDVHEGFGCVLTDDMHDLYQNAVDSDLLVLATPIYAWYCTAPMKAALDRLIYGGCKYYGTQRGCSRLAGHKIATLVTCGYGVDKGADLWDEGLRRICRHTQMDHLGMLAWRDFGPSRTFLDEKGEQKVRAYARTLIAQQERDG